MPATGQDLLGFIRQRVRSVWALELLLLMRAHGARVWSPQQLTAELRASDSLVIANLILLEKAGLLVRESQGGYRYSPGDSELRRLCDELEHAYRERPVAVVNIIAAPPDRLKSLADAFRFRGNKT